MIQKHPTDMKIQPVRIAMELVFSPHFTTRKHNPHLSQLDTCQASWPFPGQDLHFSLDFLGEAVTTATSFKATIITGHHRTVSPFCSIL
jgi:hypothetical protein